MEHLALGIDIGGTNTVFGILDPTGRIHHKRSIPTRALEGGERVMARIIETARELVQAYPVQAIGVGSAGQINPETGICAFANENLPGWTGMPIADRLRTALSLPVRVDNDANVAALAEQRFGAGRGVRDLVCITLGTGVGGGILVGGKLVTGPTGRGGEVGHIIVQTGGAPCPCGMQGCLEAYASATAIVRQAREALASQPSGALAGVEPLTAKAVCDAAAAGDPVADRVLEQTCHHLAAGIAGLISLFEPAILLLGGGVSLAGQPLLDRVDRYLQAWPMTRGRARLGFCALGDDAGVIGAAALVLPEEV